MPRQLKKNANSHRAESVPYVAAPDARVLILGSMPGVRSLDMGQYYAHPQNAFWPVMAALFDAPVETYAQKLALIRDNRLALWDVLKCCERQGSLDAAIDAASIEVNDFAGLFRRQPEITHVFFNGATSEREFLRRVLPELPETRRARLTLTRLPSTSPAHAGVARAEKLRAWRAVIQALD